MSTPAPAPRAGADGDRFFLPDFCQAPAVLAIVLIAALLGFVLALARLPAGGDFWIELARTTAFLLWAGLLCAGALCRLRAVARPQAVAAGDRLGPRHDGRRRRAALGGRVPARALVGHAVRHRLVGVSRTGWRSSCCRTC